MTLITTLSAEYHHNPLGIDSTSPRLAWQMRTNRPGARQTAYRVLAASRPEWLRDGQSDLWDSGRVDSDQSNQIPYAGQALQSRQRVYWNVCVWDETGAASESEPAWLEMGLLQRSDWQAQWIGAPYSGGPRSMFPAPYLRKPFTLPTAVTAARLYVSALGLFECSINGHPVSSDVFAPGWTDYHQRVQYHVYDVGQLLQRGDNVIGALLGDGWGVGYVGPFHRQQYADRPQLLAQLEITLADGSTQMLLSGTGWQVQFGAITHNDLVMGEAYDARKAFPGWDTPDFDAAEWLPAVVFDHPDITLGALVGAPVRRIEEIRPIKAPTVSRSFNSQRCIFDLGQNMVGRVRFRGTAPAGTTITLRFAETLNADDSLYTANLRSAHATDYYTFSGQGDEVWEPRFTFHGFRYVELLDYPGEVTADTITGIVLHSDMEQTGSFECSDPLLNQLQRNIVWGQKGNFVDVPTDCPQRDERLGWTGDIQVFLQTAAFNMNVASFMTRWLRNLADAQGAQGEIPSVVPYAGTLPKDGGPAWADAAIICPWTLYLSYGDIRVLESNYPTMVRFLDFITSESPGLIRCAPSYEGFPGFGDWLSINASTPRDLIGTAFLAWDALLMSNIATLLGKPEDADLYRALFEATRAAFASRYLVGGTAPVDLAPPSESRRLMETMDQISRGNLASSDYTPTESQVFNTGVFAPTQTAYVLALHFDLLPEHLRALAVAELVADIERRGVHLSTGFVGSPYLNQVLSSGGRADIAYQLLHQKSWPSWLYAVTQGATTIWERWDGWTPEYGFQTPEMNSFNHYAYGAIGAWLYQTAAGIQIDPAHPGYKHVFLCPVPGGELTYVKASLQTLYGELVSSWKLDGNRFEYSVVIPPNTEATVILPITGSRITLNGAAASGQVHKLSAGSYTFAVSG